MNHTRIATLLRLTLLAALLASCGGGARSGSQPHTSPAPALLLTPLAGQPIPLLPLTWIGATGSFEGIPDDPSARLGWADSIIATELLQRGPEVTWVLGEELRQAARRAGSIDDPARLGQAIFRSTSLKSAPAQFLANIRPLTTMTASRYVMIPAALTLTREADQVVASAVLVLIDARSGNILWRSTPQASGLTADLALAGLFPLILP